MCLRGVRRKSRFKNKTSWLCCSEAMASRADTALAVSLQQEHLPSSHVHLAVGTPQCHMTWTDKSVCLRREHATLAHTNTHARAVMVLLYCGCDGAMILRLLPSLALVTCHPRALSALVTRHTAPQIVTKKRKHARKKRKIRKKMKNQLLWIQKIKRAAEWKNEKRNGFLVGNYGLKKG